MLIATRTVFVSADCDGVGGGPVADAGAGQHPDAVLGPAPQLVKHERRLIEFDDRGLRVPPPRFHAKQLVVSDPAVGALGGRRLPRHAHRGRRHGHRRHIHRGRSRNYTSSTVSDGSRPTRSTGPHLQLKWRATTCRARVTPKNARPNRRNH